MQVADQIDQVLYAATQSIQLPNNQGVVLTQNFERFGKPRSLGAAAAQLVFEDLLAAGFLQCIDLEIKVLIQRRNARIADPHVSPVAATAVRADACGLDPP